ncbi:MAG: hypothetical protein AAF908_06585, partial [Pseudomonadota bacterium]
LLVLDEPNANLDAQGEQALVDAIRDAKSRGRTVIIMAHRPSAIAACDLLLMIDKGQQVDFGPRDEVLKKRTKNYQQLNQGGKAAPAPGQAAPGVAPAPTAATIQQGAGKGQPVTAQMAPPQQVTPQQPTPQPAKPAGGQTATLQTATLQSTRGPEK